MWLSKKKSSEPQRLDLTKLAVQKFDNSLVYNRFECGVRPLNKFLKNNAKSSIKRHEFKVFAATYENSPNCVGYYALQLGSDSIPESFKQKRQDYIANYSAFPAVNLSYLAVDSRFQKQGVGTYLLQDVFEKVADIAAYVGFYALTLQSYDRSTTSFYQKLGFEEYSEGAGQPKLLYPLTTIMTLLGRES